MQLITAKNTGRTSLGEYIFSGLPEQSADCLSKPTGGLVFSLVSRICAAFYKGTGFFSKESLVLQLRIMGADLQLTLVRSQLDEGLGWLEVGWHLLAARNLNHGSSELFNVRRFVRIEQGL